jgi:hypothetical protein
MPPRSILISRRKEIPMTGSPFTDHPIIAWILFQAFRVSDAVKSLFPPERRKK